ncbi:hypothetical protein GALMADRAFT_220231 [Galerina marginata CBS 339.88]|uniref:Transmembrane protein n=1 Tax=Galerina marginata (strain CBS 339.88) TaxID=685588 RepID=A0A067TMX9_GALM3|nr:hypothetical protein GALMADRAFT_220231 [Galerina marginata CBS 339.88]
MYTTKSQYRHRPVVVALIGAFLVFLPLQAYASPPAQIWGGASPTPPVSSPPSPTNINLLRRSAASNVAHDKYFIPAIASIGVVLLVALLCLVSLLRESPRPILPPVTGVGQPQPDRPPLPYLPSQTDSVSPSESVSTRSKRQTKVQRKPAPAFQPSPNQTPPGTASRPNYSQSMNTSIHPTPGVPQHPSLAMYNPEPLPFTPSLPMSVTRTAPAPGPTGKGYWTQEGPRMSSLSDGSAGQSSTQIGSGPSENALSYVSYVSGNGNYYYNHAQNEAPGDASNFVMPSRNPPSPPIALPPVQRQQNRYSRRLEKSGSTSGPSHRLEDIDPASGLPSSSQPPQYYESK